MSIEYVTDQWNPYTGCLHELDICATSPTCWAKDMSKRFKATCGGDFQPRFHPERLEVPHHWRKLRRAAVSFMGDLWGNWRYAEDRTPGNLSDEMPMSYIRGWVIQVARECPQHQLLFLTKNPAEYAHWNPWPANAWPGMSLTGAEPPERQAAMLAALKRVQRAGPRWLSYEPTLGPLAVPIPAWIDWVVVGRQTGKGAKPFNPSYLVKPFMWTEGHKPLWEKKSLAKVLGRPLVQELPI